VVLEIRRTATFSQFSAIPLLNAMKEEGAKAKVNNYYFESFLAAQTQQAIRRVKE
jgi:hypothetical protein